MSRIRTGCTTPVLRAAADPPPPPEFHLTRAAVDLPEVSSPASILASARAFPWATAGEEAPPPQQLPQLRAGLDADEEEEEEEEEEEAASGRATATEQYLPQGQAAAASTPDASVAAAGVLWEKAPRGAQQPQELRESYKRGDAEEEEEQEATAWRSNAPAHFVPRATPVAAPARNVAEAAARDVSGNPFARDRGETLQTRTRCSTWAGSSPPAQKLPPRHASSTSLSAADSRELRAHRRGHRGGAAGGSEEPSPVLVLPARQGLHTLVGIAEGEEPEATAATVVERPSAGTAVLEEAAAEKGGSDFSRRATATGKTATLLPERRTSIRNSVSSIHSCSTRSSTSGPAGASELDCFLSSSVLQQHHLWPQQRRRLPGKDISFRAADGARAVAGTAAPRSQVPEDPAGPARITSTRRGPGACSERGTEECKTGGAAAAAGRGGATGFSDEITKGLVPEEGTAGGGECMRRWLPRPFIGLSPAAQKGMPDEGEAAGIFERIWADALRRDAAQQQQAGLYMLEPPHPPSPKTAAAVAVEHNRPRTAPAREEDGEEEQEEQPQQQERQQRQQPVLLQAGAAQQT